MDRLYGGGGQFIELFYGATKENPYKDENIGFFHICVSVDDIHEAWKKIVETGAPQDDPPKHRALKKAYRDASDEHAEDAH